MDESDIFPAFIADLREAQQLENQRKQEPQAIGPLIQVYEQIVTQLQNLYSSVQNNLGLAYRDLQGDNHEDHLEQAKTCFLEAAHFWTPEAAPYEYALLQTHLGTVYNELMAGDRETHAKQAITCYQEALRFWTSETAPFEYALTQNNLGNAYSKLPTGDRAANVNLAIACFQKALDIWRPETAPVHYALAQSNLGNAYRERPTGNRAANLELAIASCREALLFLTPENERFAFASAQTNLGLASIELPTGDHAANVALAILCFEQAQSCWTPETTPDQYALIKAKLGDAYSELPTGDRTANLQQAIMDYQEALHFLTPETAPFEYALTQNNLGLAYRNLPVSDRAASLSKAITCFQKALDVWSPKATPLQYAATQNNLGNAYCDLPGDDQAINLARAIAHYEEALRFRTPERAPFDYAMTQNNLGHAYSVLSTNDRTKNVAQAIICYQEALRFWTPEAAPIECRTTNRNLGDLYLAQGEWEAALHTYQQAMDVGEQLYRAGMFIDSKAAEVARNATLYQHATLAAVRCGKGDEGLLLLERGKTQLLTEALRLQVPHPANVPDQIWQAFEQAGASVRTAQSIRTISFGKERDPLQAYTIHQNMVKDASRDLDAATELVRQHVPDFLREIDLPTIQTLLPDEHTVLLAFCITEQECISFIVHKNQEVQVQKLSTFTQAELRHLFVEVDTQGTTIGGWLGNHYRFSQKPTQNTLAVLQQTITKILAVLGQHLLKPLLSTLPLTVEQIILLPSAELFLLPLHAACLQQDDTSEFVCDRYVISYAPSIEVLAKTQAKARQKVLPELYAVINPTADPRLLFTRAERSALAGLFTQSQVDVGQIGTKQRVITEMYRRTYIHFSCHGKYNWNDPTLSGLDLADSRLTLAELQSGVADLSSARLVTLSACETGMIDVLQGSAEEYVGIPAGFLLAGVPCVVSSLWPVPDFSTTLLMERFYHNHLSGEMSVAIALREAQLWVRTLAIGEVIQYVEQSSQQAQQKDKAELYKIVRYYRSQARENPSLHPFAHPYYWAAFTVNGI